jgi:hypothetical protein
MWKQIVSGVAEDEGETNFDCTALQWISVRNIKDMCVEVQSTRCNKCNKIFPIFTCLD